MIVTPNGSPFAALPTGSGSVPRIGWEILQQTPTNLGAQKPMVSSEDYCRLNVPLIPIVSTFYPSV